MNCDLCPEGETNLGAAGCGWCLAILLELQNEGSLRQIKATIEAHRRRRGSTHDS